MSTTDDRWPYTYAAQYIVEEFGPKQEEIAESGVVPAGFSETRPVLKLHEADRLLTGICRDAGLDLRDTAERLARKYLEKKGR